MLTEQTLNFLKDNNYYFEKTSHGFRFSKKRDWSWLIITGGFAAVVVFVINIREPLLGYLSCGAIAIFVAGIILLVKNQAFFIIDHKYRTIEFKGTSMPFKIIDRLDLESEFIAEYTSAFKETSQEYRTSINLHFTRLQERSSFQFQDGL